MPYKFQTDKVKMPRKHDKRVKLTNEQKDEIRSLKGMLSIRKIADKYGVSARLVTFIFDPEELTRNLQLRKERGGSKMYYDKEKHKENMRIHRRYKQKVLTGKNVND